jgi:hypothetical protein
MEGSMDWLIIIKQPKNSNSLTPSFSTIPAAPCTEADSKVNIEVSRYAHVSSVFHGVLLMTHVERSQLLPVRIELVVVELDELFCG